MSHETIKDLENFIAKPARSEILGTGMNMKSPRAGLVGAFLILILLALFSVAGYYQLFGTFSNWDDEGYLMLSLHQYIQTGRVLYDQIYSQYGPFYYLFHRVLHGTLHVPITNDAARWVFLGYWLLLVVACFRLVFFLTASNVTAFLACVPFGWMLRQLSAEPAHPQGLVLILIGFVLVSPSLLNWNSAKRSVAFAAMGIGTTALLLVKPNIGGYLLLAVLWAMLSMTPNGPGITVARYVLAVACFVLPAVLMASHLKEHWAQKYALLTMITLAPMLLLLSAPSRRMEIRAKEWKTFAASFVLAAMAIVLLVMLDGTSLRQLISVLLIQPLHFASAFFTPLNFDRSAFAWAALSLVLFAAFFFVDRVTIDLLLGRQIRRRSVSVTRDIPVGAFLQAFFGLTAMYYFYSGRYMDVWERATPFLWVALIPCRSSPAQPTGTYFVRVLLVVTAAFQLLHAYPVAGSQFTWSLIWLVPTAMVSLHDGFSVLPVSVSVRRVAAVGLVVSAIVSIVPATRELMDEYRSLEPIGLPGAARVRTDWILAETYRWLADNVNAQADTFVAMPGLDSLYLWTGKQPPGALSGGFWMAMLAAEQQKSTINAVSRFSKVAAIRNKRWAEFWTRGRDFSDRPLVSYVDHNFKTIGRVGNYEFMVPIDEAGGPLRTNPLLSFSIMQLQDIFIRHKPRVAAVDEKSVLLSSSDNEIRFQWPMDARRISGTVGLYPKHCGPDSGHTVRLIIEKETLRGKTRLLEQTLSPATGDHGIHSFDVPVPGLEMGTLHLVTNAVASSPLDECVYWSDIMIR